jgi:hypothetical protein
LAGEARGHRLTPFDPKLWCTFAGRMFLLCQEGKKEPQAWGRRPGAGG